MVQGRTLQHSKLELFSYLAAFNFGKNKYKGRHTYVVRIYVGNTC